MMLFFSLNFLFWTLILFLSIFILLFFPLFFVPKIKISYFGTSIMAEKDAMQNQKLENSYYSAPKVIKKC